MSAKTAKPRSELPDRAAVVMRALLEFGLASNRSVLVPARVLAQRTKLTSWNVAYGLGYLSLAGKIRYEVKRDFVSDERLYRIVLAG